MTDLFLWTKLITAGMQQQSVEFWLSCLVPQEAPEWPCGCVGDRLWASTRLQATCYEPEWVYRLPAMSRLHFSQANLLLLAHMLIDVCMHLPPAGFLV
jgi:hypothetical protein